MSPGPRATRRTRSSSAAPPRLTASIAAEPTITPSAPASRSAATCAPRETPKPHRSGSPPACARTRASRVRSRSTSSASRAPVVPIADDDVDEAVARARGERDPLRRGSSSETSWTRSMPFAAAAARELAPPPRAGCRRRSARSRRPRPRRCRSARRRSARRSPRTSSARAGSPGRSPRASRRARRGSGAGVMPASSAAWPAAWIVGPSASGSENGMPTSIDGRAAAHGCGGELGQRVARPSGRWRAPACAIFTPCAPDDRVDVLVAAAGEADEHDAVGAELARDASRPSRARATTRAPG